MYRAFLVAQRNIYIYIHTLRARKFHLYRMLGDVFIPPSILDNTIVAI